MEEQKLYELMNSNLGFYLATMDSEQPRVRGVIHYILQRCGFLQNGLKSLIIGDVISMQRK